jgi:teichuronic acid biosynthesis glycosyltransferase TuaH
LNCAVAKPDVVFFTLFRTDNPYSSISLSMAKELARQGHRVFYVNHPYTLKDVATGMLRGDRALRRRLKNVLTGRTTYETLDAIPQNFVAATPPATLPINWLPPGRLYDSLQRRNNDIVLRTISKALREHGVRDFIFINCYDPFYAGYLPAEFGARLSIYHCIDDITQNAYTDKHGTKLENEAAARADVTFVTSTNLARLKAPYARRIEHYFNAADNAVFERVLHERFPRPAELDGRPGPVIGFIGNLDELRIDYPLLKKIAEANPDKTLLLVGPVNSPEPKQLGLDKLPNVVFAGPRRLDELPALVQHMDCALIPFRCNTLTASIYPLKINEYLAAGKAVVSTTFSDDIRSFAPYIYLAEDHDAFLRQIDAALAERDPAKVEERVGVSRGNSWEARIRQLWEVVAALAAAKNRATFQN